MMSMNGKWTLALAVFAALFAGTVSAATYDVKAYGAKPDGETDNTAAIQKAIDECSDKGGGMVLVPGGGVYKTYTLNLKNGVELHIDRGATLKAGEDPYRFPEFQPTPVWNVERSPRFNRRAMFYTCGQTNVAITGAGTIDGNAEAYHHRVNGRWQRISHTNICGRCVFFVGCRDVRFDDVLVYHPCGWSTWFFDCDRVQCRGVRIECHREYPNGDGLHFGGCRDVTVSDCIIDAQDDALIVRTHQEQMKKVRPCERMAFANCVLRSNQSAIRIGWTEDGPIRDVSFDNIVCTYSRLGVQFFLPPLRDGPGEEYMDPPRGRGLVPPPQETIVPFSVENMRFSNMSISSFSAPLFIDIANTENVEFLKNISFSHCRFRSQQPPLFRVRPEDNVRDWRFSDVTFEVERPRGSLATASTWWSGASPIWFPNARDIIMDNVRWSWMPQDRPEWYATLFQDGSDKPVSIVGSRQIAEVEEPEPGVRRFVYDRMTDGEKSWAIRTVIEERAGLGGKTYTGRIENSDKGITVTAFEGPYFDRIRVAPRQAALYVPQGFGRRVGDFPKASSKVGPEPKEFAGGDKSKGVNWPGASAARWDADKSMSPIGWFRLPDGRFTYLAGFYPGGLAMTMPWTALDTGFGTLYLGVHDAKARAKRFRLRWDPSENRADAAFDHRFFLKSGESFELPETVFERVKGDWHDAAKRYRRWYDTVRQVRATTPAWTRQVAGWLLVIMKQQNEDLFWPYTDIPKLCDVCEKNGLDCIGLFGWTKGGHDHLYPDYDPDPKMGGVEALKAGIAEAHRRGIKVYIYANGQLQHIGATKFWDEHGKNLALTKRNGEMVVQTYHKFRDIPKYEFALGCLYGKPWHERMYSLAVQAESFGADGILYDQLGIFAPFACYGKGHGHATPHYAYAEERPGFVRSIADEIQKKNPDFAILTEGLHDSILDSIGLFHGCQYGTFLWDSGKDLPARSTGKVAGSFPELWRYTFPELASTLRYPTPMIHRTLVNYAAAFGFRHDLEVRYAPDRKYVLEGKVPTKADYGTVTGIPDVTAMAEVSPAEASAYLKGVCDFQRKYAPYLLTGTFVDTDGVSQANPAVIAKRFVAADGTSVVCAWNVTDKPTEPTFAGSAAPKAVDAPAGTPTTGPIPANSLRLYRW